MRRPNARSEVDSKSEVVDMNKTDTTKNQFRLNARSNLLARNSKQTSKLNLFIIVLFTVTLVGLIFCYYGLFARNSRYFVKKNYRIIIDGGSTGTRIHVFGYGNENGKSVFDFGKSGLATMKVSPGLSAYEKDPEGAGGSLSELLAFGKEKVPKDYWSETEIRVMATAGLRMLELHVQERILESCRSALGRSGFKFRDEWASVITGPDEGMYAWVVANYALGTLGGNPLQTTGIIELGGASAQVTFVSSEQIPAKFTHTVKFGNHTYNLYSHSLLHYGQNVAFDSFRDSLVSQNFNLDTESVKKRISRDPCMPKGYMHDTESWKLSPGSLAQRERSLFTLESWGNFSECRSAALMLLQKGKELCSYKHCNIGSTFLPKLQGRFLFTENFFHTSKFFGLTPRASLADLMMAGQEFCGEDWSKLKKKYQSLNEEDLQHYCFSSAYIVAFLHDSLEISLDDERIWFANQVGNIPLDWALGAFILQSATDVNIENGDWVAAIISEDSPMLFVLIAISIGLVITGWYVFKCRKPQLKTIYDLEKGRYIVTRINRSS